MPSWNIHIAQTERLLERIGALANSVRDRNAFLFGCVVPDIFVGYMVPGIADPIPYRITHFAKPEPIPKPREHEFWDTYVAPLLKGAPVGTPAAATSIVEERERLNRVHYPQRYKDAEPVAGPGASELSLAPDDVAQSLLDLTLGVWSHLVADTVWNTRVNQYLEAHGGKPCEEFRIKSKATLTGLARHSASFRFRARPIACILRRPVLVSIPSIRSMCSRPLALCTRLYAKTPASPIIRRIAC